MKALFNLDNPVWKFIGNLADFCLLSFLWALCSLPVITLGASTSALYYTTLKMASNQEGYTFSSFWNSFKSNLLSGIKITVILLLTLLIILSDAYYCIVNGSSILLGLLFPLGILLLGVILTFRMVTVLLARLDNSVKNLIFMSVSMSIKNIMPVLTTIIVSIGIYSFGIFIFWPILLVTPGLCAYINSFIFNHILNKYGFALT